MKKNSQTKARLLHLRDILLEETDDDHSLVMPEILEKLEERGVSAERKAIYNDLEVLKESGLDIVVYRGSRAEYSTGNRQFELPEVLLLADAVQSSRFLTKKKSEVLIKKLKKFTSVYQAELLDKSMHVEGRIKMQNESIYYNVDAIQEAIKHKNKISFYYFKYGLDKAEVLRRDGGQYLESPMELIYKDEYYYLITYNEKHDDYVRYRVDRMIDIVESEESISSSKKVRSFDAQEFCSYAFGMFDGDATSTDLLVDPSIMGSIIDRFGKDVQVYTLDEKTVRVHVKVLKSSVFFGWVAQFGNLITIEKPASLAREYKAFLQSILSSYEES